MVGFFCGPWKEAIIVEKYLPNVCSDLSFHNHINYQRNPVVFIHVFIYHIHSFITLCLLIFPQKSDHTETMNLHSRIRNARHRQHMSRIYFPLKEKPTNTIVKSQHVCGYPLHTNKTSQASYSNSILQFTLFITQFDSIFFSSDENNEYISLILSMEIDNRKRIRRFYTFYWYDTTPNIVI